jgi:hypothetical protein
MMLGRLCTCSLALICSVPLLALGQPATKPAAAAPPPVMAVVDYDNLPLEEVLKALNNVGPSFQAVLAGDSSGASVNLHLKDVTPEQVLRVIQEQSGLKVQPVGTPPIYVVSVPQPAVEHVNSRVTAYCLTPIIDSLLLRTDRARRADKPTTRGADEILKARTAAMNDVVAVVQTAVTIAPDQVTATMITVHEPTEKTITVDGATATVIEVHEPTEMLILKGSPEQREAAEGVLRALEPQPGTVVEGPPRSAPSPLRGR